ncbi:hypothetical protein NPIL_561711, partial [Nephila pilipes]
MAAACARRVTLAACRQTVARAAGAPAVAFAAYAGVQSAGYQRFWLSTLSLVVAFYVTNEV